ncbi:MAG: NADH:ubiquinone reductase (Na(+)-transporting) subunit B [Saprospiraceae bacterium]|nr:NADH:ubiquinone reductase (Na(+)-transporting) subunit B [Saprospiraceae bacterium]
MSLLNFLKKIEPDKKKSPFLHTLYDGFFTFAYTPNFVTKDGVHIRDGMDLKRLMVHVVLAMQLCFIFGTYNIGHQHFVATGEYLGFLEGFHLKLAFGLIQMLPIVVVAHVVGLGIEFFYAAKKGHGIEEGFLVSGALIPLIMPPDIPLWILALSVAFAVIIGKEAFGGTGMNIWNIALLSRVFVFFAYPLTISGDQCWISGFEKISGGASVHYNWWHTGFFNSLFEWMGLDTFNSGLKIVDGFSGATPLALAFEGGWDKVTQYFSESQMLWGAIPGSIGETNKIFIIVGALFLIATKVASWRIMAGMMLGLIATSLLLNVLGSTPFMQVTWTQHLLMGSFLFAMAFMATDPVTASSTNKGKWIYGFFIGVIGLIIRVMNPAYPEGWMLAILLMNTFAPTIDYFILESNIKKRMNRV